jgi:K+/H+ antiporter YhaU regulatory subunit KhtT
LSNVSFQSKEDTERQVKNALERMQEQEESYKTIQKEMDEINEARLNILNDNFKEIMTKTSLSNKIPKEQ